MPNYKTYNLDAEAEIAQYKLDQSTFDIVDVDKFHNTNFSTLFWYMWMWILMVLSWVLLGSDIYLCLNILVFHKWSSSDYKPYAYAVAKWLFTACIIFEICLLIVRLLWAIRIYRTRNIALAFINPIARQMYSVKSYNYFCLFNKIEMPSFFSWACLYCNQEFDNSLQILAADAPRQAINILTLRFYATGGDYFNNNILKNIETIATTNLRLAIILSFMCVSLVIWAFFFFEYLYGMLLWIPIWIKMHNKTGYYSLRRYCCELVNDAVRLLVLRNHRSKTELLEKGILDQQGIDLNPLLKGGNGTVIELFASKDFNSSGHDSDYEYTGSIQKPRPIHKGSSYTSTAARPKPYEKNSSYTAVRTTSFDTLPTEDMSTVGSIPAPSLSKMGSQPSFHHPYDVTNPFVAPRKGSAGGRRKHPMPPPDPFKDRKFSNSSSGSEQNTTIRGQDDSYSESRYDGNVIPQSDSKTALNEEFDNFSERNTSPYNENESYQPQWNYGNTEAQNSQSHLNPNGNRRQSESVPYPTRGVSQFMDYDYEEDIQPRYNL
ncbi:uncharacterized protein RJT20DRAFT_32064 [Scheffersomyces xylosifermentans]|uniref:uncharacterized protein n=1 Tax=Scheffersomyces xylosifermentans TaxID=1304137 RepID=UPI00315D681F